MYKSTDISMIQLFTESTAVIAISTDAIFPTLVYNKNKHKAEIIGPILRYKLILSALGDSLLSTIIIKTLNVIAKPASN